MKNEKHVQPKVVTNNQYFSPFQWKMSKSKILSFYYWKWINTLTLIGTETRDYVAYQGYCSRSSSQPVWGIIPHLMKAFWC